MEVSIVEYLRLSATSADNNKFLLAIAYLSTSGCMASRITNTNSLNSRKEVDFVWTSVQQASIMLAVGSANLSLLAVSFWSAASASFSRTSWRASIWAPFLAAPKVIWAVPFSNLQEMHHGKEALLWQSEL